MASRKSISQELRKTSHKHRQKTDTFYRRFQLYFKYLFDPEALAKSPNDFDDLYIENEELEDNLKIFLNAGVGSIAALTGLEGSGKSTYISKIFGVRSNVYIIDNKLIMPFHINSYHKKAVNPADITIKKIRASISKIRDEYEIVFSTKDFYSFAKAYKEELLTEIDDDDDPDAYLTTTPDEQLKLIYKNNPYAYYALQLKFFANQTNLEKIVIVIDDVETATYEEQKDILVRLLEFRRCLKSLGDAERTYEVGLLFSCRPATLENLRSDPLINGFSDPQQISVGEPVGISGLVEKRFNLAIKKVGQGLNISGDPVESIETWKEAYRIFQKVTFDFIDRFEKNLVGLCNNNLRKLLTEIPIALANSRWFENRDEINDSHSGVFKISADSYTRSEAGFYRAISCRDNDFFNDSESPIVGNIFKNKHQDDADLLVSYIIKFFSENARNGHVVYLSKKSLLNKLEILYPIKVVDANFEDALNYMVRKGFLRFEELRRGTIDYEINVIGLPRLYSHWRMIRRSSILNEFFRDECFINQKDFWNFQLKGKNVGTSTLPGHLLFPALIAFIEQIAQKEAEIRKRITDFEIYTSNFGIETISERLYIGINNSIERFYGSGNVDSEIQRSNDILKSFLIELKLLRI